MSISVLRNFVKEALIETYSPGLIKTLTQKFKKENPELSDEVIRYYIDKFDQNKNGPRIKGAGKSIDIMTYKWSELEKLIDANFSTSSAGEVQIQTGMKPVYQSEDGSLQIFLGDRKEKCIAIRQNFEKRTGERYTWCISRADASNAFVSYRFRANEPMFYFVFDTERQKSDLYHAVVIYPNSSGEYMLATSKNTGDVKVTWEQISQKMPKLKSLQSIFKHIPLTEKERKIHQIIKDKKSDEEFAQLSYDLKEAYISYNHVLSANQIRNVYETDKDLVNKYCNLHKEVVIPLDIWKKLPPATKKVVKDGFKGKLVVFYILYEGKTSIKGGVSIDGKLSAHLPDGLIIGGSLKLSRHESAVSLPKNLSVGKNLILYGTSIAFLPEGLKVGGDLDIGHTKIVSFPEDLQVGGGLKLFGTKITSLPEGLKTVGGDLDISHTKITSLPEGMSVEGSLSLMYTQINSLPESLRNINGSLDLFGSSVVALPTGLKVENDLNIMNTQIFSLPEGLSVGRNLYINNLVTALPKKFFIRGRIIGNDKLKKQLTLLKKKSSMSESTLIDFVRSVLS